MATSVNLTTEEDNMLIERIDRFSISPTEVSPEAANRTAPNIVPVEVQLQLVAEEILLAEEDKGQDHLGNKQDTVGG